MLNSSETQAEKDLSLLSQTRFLPMEETYISSPERLESLLLDPDRNQTLSIQ